jgi:hypothetical protein
MNAGFQFVREQFVDGAVALDAAHAGKVRRNDADAEMRLAGAGERRMMAGLDVMMAGVKVAFVDDGEPFGRKRRFQLVFHRRLYGHPGFPSPHLRHSRKIHLFDRF